MNIFHFRDELIRDYAEYIASFINVRDTRILDYIEEKLKAGVLWPQPLIQLNPSFEPGANVEDFVREGVLHQGCAEVFRRSKKDTGGTGLPLRLHTHQEEAIRVARQGRNYVLTTGTGSGKSLAYIIPIVDRVLRQGSGKGIKAIVVYPMNALANSQFGELEKFLCEGFPDGKGPVTFARYTGQERDEKRTRIIQDPPDILLTNYVMLELVLTRPQERPLIQAARGLEFLVLDELHTYRGRQGADVSLLVRRVRNLLGTPALQCVGTSATLAGPGTFDEQRKEVSRLASSLFGAPVEPADVICETLRRITAEADIKAPNFVSELKNRIADPERNPPTKFQAFIHDPLSIWIESTFGITREEKTNRLIRTKPSSIYGPNGAGEELSRLTGVPRERAQAAIEQGLLAGYTCEPSPDTGFPVFAFRLHQFISRGDAVFASIEPEDKRYLTVYGQQFVPDDRSRLLFPLAFCRECGQDYYLVRRNKDIRSGSISYRARELNERESDEKSEAGFIYLSSSKPWPVDVAEVIGRLPDDWIEDNTGVSRIRANRQKDLPRQTLIGTDGQESADGHDCVYFSAPFRFCLHCGVSYSYRQTTDFTKLTSLGSGGRSTATTILSLSVINNLRDEETLPIVARKLLSFTDNRQDASLQAGHFNDFVEIGLLRSAIYRAALKAASDGLQHDELTLKVFDALGLPFASYASDPDARFQAESETKKALRDVLGYLLYHDLKRGWRVTSPNLEQCGLLEIAYLSLKEVTDAEDVWKDSHQALVTAKPETRMRSGKTLLDFMRRELAINVNYLDRDFQEQIQQRSSQRLIPPWAIDENERPEHASVVFPRSRRPDDFGGYTFISQLSGFGQYLRRRSTFPDYPGLLKSNETAQIIVQLLQALKVAGIVKEVVEPRLGNDVSGYQIVAGAMAWKAGDGTRAFHDPIRMPSETESGGRTNVFFVNFYRSTAARLQGIHAKEHTAQVPNEERQVREEAFREARLPILYCSPTMELGIDIKELNIVNLRNIPPTPANYAQRSGRAGRSGQPALVFSYCSTGSPHDQYFFKRPELMVSGAVAPPRLDLANEDLLKAHIQAIWLTETRQSLGTSVKDILDLTGEDPSLNVLPGVRMSIEDSKVRERARTRAVEVIESIKEDLAKADWYSEGWLDEILNKVVLSFDRACNRWRTLYRAARNQAATQGRIILDATRSPAEKAEAKRLRDEAEAQLKLLLESENVFQSDFYSYRYFGSEGFLPGYNFPRLPLSAFIPGRRMSKKSRDEFLSRPRFLAISEFGPRAVIYHEGSRYLVNKVILPIAKDDVASGSVKICPACGYLHPTTQGYGPDLCERCHTDLGAPLTSMFRLENVVAKRRDKINSDEEERLRLGYELKTGIRFLERSGTKLCRTASVRSRGVDLASMTYGHASTIWRINYGWRRRKDKEKLGFVLDVERGYWARNEQAEEDDDPDPMSVRTARVIPYVEDRRNSLLIEFRRKLNNEEMTSLEAALKRAIQVEYELEDSEIASEPLPNQNDRRLLLFYEAAEGGAGVLRRLVDDSAALARVARQALKICHFNPDTGDDLRRGPAMAEDCEAACYDCLMSYYNQTDHPFLDRKLIKDLLLELISAEVETSPTVKPRAEHLANLVKMAGSSLERDWLEFLEAHDYRLPTQAQPFVASCKTRPDFLYGEGHQAAIYVDGPHHEFPERRQRDGLQSECMEDHGYTVIRFGPRELWSDIVRQFPSVFGLGEQVNAAAQPKAGPTAPVSIDLDLFDPKWHTLLKELVEKQAASVEPGEDVEYGGEIIGSFFAKVTIGGKSVKLVDDVDPRASDIRSALVEQGNAAVVLGALDVKAGLAAIAAIVGLGGESAL